MRVVSTHFVHITNVCAGLSVSAGVRSEMKAPCVDTSWTCACVCAYNSWYAFAFVSAADSARVYFCYTELHVMFTEPDYIFHSYCSRAGLRSSYIV